MPEPPQHHDTAADEQRKRQLIQAARLHADGAAEETATHRASDPTPNSGKIQIRCPSCHTPVEVAVDTSFTDLTCDACGSHFSLVDQEQATRLAPSLSKLGRFELIERIGVGGFGSVWKARDKELDRTVAIKVPRQGGMTPEEQEKFLREARAAAQLKHPNIVSVHEVGRDGDSIFIVSDFVRGVTLGDWLTGQQITGREAAELTAKIADALHHAHQQGVVHRDLKPANIMIDGEGQPHIMDFGLARRELGEVTMTVDGHVLGTPAYMSPEQAIGASHHADRRSDVYSLGVILFQLLTSELPFRGNARMLVHQVINDEPPSPRKFNAAIPKDLETITLKCLEKDRNRRYPTAAELGEELHRYLKGEPINARPVGRIERGWRWCKRNRSLASLLSILLLGAITATWGCTEQRRLKVAAEKATHEAEVARERLEIRSRRLEGALHFAIGLIFDDRSRSDNLPWERLERIVDSSSKFEINLPYSSPIPRSDTERQLRWQDARKYSMIGLVHLMAAEGSEAVSAENLALESWQAVFADEEFVDLVTLELITIASARIPLITSGDARTKSMEVLEMLNTIWTEIDYPDDFKAVGMVYVAEGLNAAGDQKRSLDLAKQASELLINGRYPSSAERARKLIEKSDH